MMVYSHEYLLETAKATKKIKQQSYILLGNIKGKKILDLGCGNGIDVLKLAVYVEDHGKVIGIDKNINLLKEAKENLSKTNFNNVQFIQADAENIPFENEYFDAIRVERVFQHLVNPRKVIQEIKRVLKWNSQLVIVETDWASLSIFTENHEIEKKLINYLVYKFINNGLASRLLIEYLCSVSFKNIHTEMFPSVIPSYHMANQFIKLEEIANKAIKEGDLEKDVYLKWLKQVHQSDLKRNFKCCLNMLTVSARKMKTL